MKLVCPSVLSPVRTGSCLVLTLLLALPLAPRTASAGLCTFPDEYDCGDRWEFTGLLAFLSMYTENCCRNGRKVKLAGPVSAQQWLDGIPACLGPEDGGAYYFPLTDPAMTDLAILSTNLSKMWSGVYTKDQYPTRQIQLVHSYLGDGPLPDTDRYQFSGTAGSNVVIRLTEEIAMRSPVILRHGDAILTLTGPDGASVVKRARSLLPVELRATLPAAGTYTLAVSQRAGSERSFAGNYRLTFKHTSGPVATNATGEVEFCLIRSPIDPELDQPATILADPGAPAFATRFAQCPGPGNQIDKCTKSLTATISLLLCPSMLTYHSTSGYVPDCSDSPVRIYGKAVSVNKGLATVRVVFPLEPSFGVTGIAPPQLDVNFNFVSPAVSVINYE